MAMISSYLMSEWAEARVRVESGIGVAL